MTSTELVPAGSRIPSATEVKDLTVLANQLGQSGFFKDVRTGYQAFAKLLFGRDLGLSATAAMTGVHIIEGKPEISANVQAQMVKTYVGPEGERYDYRVREHDNEHCKLEFFRRERGKEWESLGFSEYTMKDAAAAQLAGKGNWKKHPRNMLFARAISDGVAFQCPEVTNGIRVYHDYEIDVDGAARDVAPVVGEFTLASDVVDGNGEIVERPEGISEGDAEGIAASIRGSGVSEQWTRMQLVALGVENVPEALTVEALRTLTPTQAREFLSALNAHVDQQYANDEQYANDD